MKRLLIVALLLVGCGSAAPSPALHALAGSVVLFNGEAQDVERGDGDCRGTGGFDDIRAGVEVTVRDDTARIIATGRLAALPADESGNAGARQRERWTCRYTFTASVPDAPFYTIEVGDRGDVTFDRDELAARQWTAELTLGG